MGKPEYEPLSRDQLEALCGDLTIHVEHYKKEYHKEKQNRISLDRTLTLPNGVEVRRGCVLVHTISSERNVVLVSGIGDEIFLGRVIETYELQNGRWVFNAKPEAYEAPQNPILDWRPCSEVYPDRPVPGSE